MPFLAQRIQYYVYIHPDVTISVTTSSRILFSQTLLLYCLSQSFGNAREVHDPTTLWPVLLLLELHWPSARVQGRPVSATGPSSSQVHVRQLRPHSTGLFPASYWVGCVIETGTYIVLLNFIYLFFFHMSEAWQKG